jgi:Mg-chelatase subunit ChlI
LSDEEDFEQVIDTLRLGSPPTTHWKRREVGNDHHDHTNAYASAHANANANTNVNADDADDDDGDVLAMLLQRQQKMRENQSREDSEQVGTLVESGLPQESESESSRLRESQNSNASVDRVEDTIDSPAHRR